MDNTTPTRVDVRLMDKLVLDIISARADERTSKARITIDEISYAVGCHWNTAWKSTKRLIRAGHLKQLAGRGHHGSLFEVLQVAAKNA